MGTPFQRRAEEPDAAQRKIVGLVLGKHKKHQQLLTRGMPEVDGPRAAKLASAAGRPPNLPEGAGSLDHLARFRPLDQRELEELVLSGESNSSMRRVKVRVSTMTTGAYYAPMAHREQAETPPL
jgi:hypothetical protein